MRKVVGVFVVLGVIAGLCVGCGKKAESETAVVVPPKESSAKKWAPETAPVPKAHDPHDGHDHSGHNH
ncbi:MAG: hypothetical protein ISS31_04855 [Kiritimatiellae bacterium]|nr:hypothetical protein [Kiritimatiellia bacterium]